MQNLMTDMSDEPFEGNAFGGDSAIGAPSATYGSQAASAAVVPAPTTARGSQGAGAAPSAPRAAYDKRAVENLAKRAMRGNREALIDLCNAIARDVLFRVMRRLPDRTEAEDVAQEVLIRVCANIRTLKHPKNFGAWLNSIIKNETNRYAKAELAAAPILDIQEYLDTAEEENAEFLPQEYVLRQEDRQAVMRIVDALPERQLEAVMLHYYEGMGVTEAAKAMGVTKQGVSRYLALAREKIKSEIEAYAHRESDGTVALNGLVGLPIGLVLTQAFSQEAGQPAFTSGAWLQQAANSYSHAVGGTGHAAKGLAAAKAAAITLVATAAVVAGVLAYGTEKQAESAQAQAGAPVTGTVVFEGGESGLDHLNPTHIYVQSNAGLTVAAWKITTAEEGKTLASGTDSNIDPALAQLRANGEEGEYQITLTLNDEAGGVYTLSRSFSIRDT